MPRALPLVLLSFACGKVLLPPDDSGVSIDSSTELVSVDIVFLGDGDGQVISDDGVLSCNADCRRTFARGSTLVFRAQAAGTSSFVSWSGACAGNDTACPLTLADDTRVEARFDRLSRSMVVMIAGSGSGTVADDKGELSCPDDCDAIYPAGSRVTLTATPNARSTFDGWSLASCDAANPCTVQLDAALSVTANFGIRTYSLTVSKAGPGDATVVSTPPGIECGTQCTARFSSDTRVELTYALLPNSRFVGWSGDCSGNSCSVTIASDSSVTASFERVPLVVAGGSHSCAVLADGRLQCWGYNGNGQLGLGHQTNLGTMELASAIAPVDFPTNVRQLCSSGLHTCALFDGGQIRCWGWNFDGQLGLNHNLDIGDDANDLPISTNVQLGAAAKQIACGGNHTCALLSDGRVRCWGRGSAGQLGYNCAANIGDGTFDCDSKSLNDDVPLGGVAVQIAAGNAHTCAALDDGALRCWGNNQSGGLGYGHTDNLGDDAAEMPVPDVPLPGPVSRIALGDYHTCAVVGSNDIYCWGQNLNGELGEGTTMERWSPPQVPLDLGASLAQIEGGSNHTCVRTVARTLRCFGRGLYGQLGYGTSASVGDDPADVIADLPLTDVVSVSAGGQHTCALTADDRVFCWGRGQEGQLGSSSAENVLTAGSNPPVF
jgi:alpha-tubulin suppressor-like RCC1 family protein